jgi:hypothetical protein
MQNTVPLFSSANAAREIDGKLGFPEESVRYVDMEMCPV